MFPTIQFFKPKKPQPPISVFSEPKSSSDMQDSIFIGTTSGKKRVYIHLDEFLEAGLRFVIIGQSGSGKSFLTRVVIEEFIEKGRRTVTFDPEGEWYSLRDLKKDKVTVIGGDEGLSIGVDPDDEDYEFNDETILKIMDTVTPKIEQLLETKGRSIVFDLSGFEDEEQQSVYALISGILFRLQKIHKKTVFVMVDEASLYAPQNEASNAKKLKSGKKLNAKTASKRNARRGRKFGLRQGYALQRPADFNKGVLANCTLRFIGKMEEENDFEAIVHLLRPKETLISFDTMKSLKPGQFYMCYKGNVSLIQVKSKTKTKHIGSTPEDDY